MRFLLRVDSHARNHSAHPQAQSQVAALRACAAARSGPRVSLGALHAAASPCPSSTVRSRTGAGSTGKTAFTTTTGHMHRGAALELRCSGVWS